MVVDPVRNGWVLEQSFSFRPEHKQVTGRFVKIVERIFDEPVVGDEESAAIGDGQCEHAIETLQGCRAPLAIGVQIRFRVAPSPILAAKGFESGPQFEEAVQLAFEDDVGAPVLGADQLVAGFQVDNRQAGAWRELSVWRTQPSSSEPRWRSVSFIRGRATASSSPK